MQTAAAGGATSSGGSCTAGTATAGDALAGVTFPDGSGGMTTGTMTNVGAFNLTGAFSAGYISSLTGLAASSVCSTTSLLGSAGTATCVTGTADAVITDVATGKKFWNAAGGVVTGTGTVVTGSPDAVVGNVLSGKTFWNAAGAPVTGTMANNGSANLSSTSPSAAGYYSGFTNGTPTNTTVCNGTTILGTAGSAVCVTGSADAIAGNVATGKTFWNAAGGVVTGTATVVTGSPDAVVGNVLTGKTFWNAAGAVVTGTMTNQGSWSLSGASAIAAPAFPGAGYYSGITNAPATTNYCAGTYINGSNGTAVCAGGATTGTTIAAGQVCSGYSGYNLAGTAINGSNICSLSGTPTTISGIKLWLKPDAIYGLNSQPTDTASVPFWYDSSGNNNHAIQISTSANPVFRSHASYLINSVPVVYFGGTAGLRVPSLSLTTFSIFAVYKISGNGLVYEHSVNVNANDGCYLFTTTGDSIHVSRGATHSGRDKTGSWGSGNTVQATSHMYGGTHATHSFYVNGVDQAAVDGGNGTGNPGSAAAAQPFYIGGRAGTSVFITGSIAEIIVYSPVLSSGDRITVECYLSTKYGLGIAGC